MDLIADGLLVSATLVAALYCYVLSRRIHALKNLESGLGGAIAALSSRVEETRRSLTEAKEQTEQRSRELGEMVARAEIAAGRLELLIASLHEEDAARGHPPADAVVPVEKPAPKPAPEDEKTDVASRIDTMMKAMLG